MAWTELWFGKHKGKTLPQLAFADPDYLFWALEEGVFDGKGALEREAEIVGERAQRISLPPSPDGGPRVVEYLIHRPTKKFGLCDVVPADRELHVGSSPAFRGDCFDLSVPRQIARYDKSGCKTMVKSVKSYLFGSSKARMTKKRCEDFFDDEANFDL